MEDGSNSLMKKMKSHKNLYRRICSFENLCLAFEKARKRKRKKKEVSNFEYNMERELLRIIEELETLSYQPSSPKRFFLHEPKKRDIWVVDFRDRVVHHALYNIIEPIFDRSFINDSYACRKYKGTHKAIRRFDAFKRKVTKNNTQKAYVLKADVKKYFDNISHKILLEIIRKKVKDEKTMQLIERIVENHEGKGELEGKGIPIGNLTSQLFANIYLNELDHFVKEKLKTRYYLRYMDDLIILSHSTKILLETKDKIKEFLDSCLNLRLHPQKTRIFPIINGVDFLGYEIFYHYKLLRKGSVKRIEERIKYLNREYRRGKVRLLTVHASIMAWLGYAKHANIYRLRSKLFQNLHFLVN